MREAAVALVVRELLLQEAAALGVSPAVGKTPPQRKSAPSRRCWTAESGFRPRMRKPAGATTDANRQRFRSPDLFEASHILFAARPDQPEERKRARAAAAATLDELRRDPSFFERLAKERSDDPESRD